MRMRIVTTAFAALTVASALLAGGTARARDVPETVLITFRPKSGAEQELADVIARHWAEARRLDLVVALPHLTLRGRDGAGRIVLTELLTWRDAGIPDAAPPAILDIWKRMNELVESRDGRPGLVFDVVTVLSPDAAEPSR
jgi:hypothetical protein